MPCTCKVPFILAQILFACLGIVIIAVGAWVWYTVGAVIAWMPILIVLSGVAVLVVTVVGCLGAGYDKENPSEKLFRKTLMLIYFFVFLVIDLILGVASTLCLVAWEKVKAIVAANLPKLIEIVKDYWPIPEGTNPYSDKAVEYLTEKIMTNLKIVGGIGVAIAIVFLLGLVMAGFILGYEAVFTHTLSFGNLILAFAGGCLIALGLFVYTTGIIQGKGVPLAIGLIGICIMLIAGVGFLASCCNQKACCKCFLCIYALVLCVLIVAVVILGIVAAAMTNTAGEMIDTFCNSSQVAYDTCVSIYTFVCDRNMNCSATGVSAAEIIQAIKGYVKGNLYMVGAAAIWIGVCMVYLIVAALIVRSIKPKNEGATKQDIPVGTPQYPAAQQF